jgi:hypothetical protein
MREKEKEIAEGWYSIKDINLLQYIKFQKKYPQIVHYDTNLENLHNKQPANQNIKQTHSHYLIQRFLDVKFQRRLTNRKGQSNLMIKNHKLVLFDREHWLLGLVNPIISLQIPSTADKVLTKVPN